VQTVLDQLALIVVQIVVLAESFSVSSILLVQWCLLATHMYVPCADALAREPVASWQEAGVYQQLAEVEAWPLMFFVAAPAYLHISFFD
jgi:hypothetical protein